MVLRNAFADMSTEATVAAVLAAVESLTALVADERPQVNASPPYARDAGDRLRVLIDTTSTVNVGTVWWGNTATYPTYYGIGAPVSMDPREDMALQSRISFQQARSRWVVT